MPVHDHLFYSARVSTQHGCIPIRALHGSSPLPAKDSRATSDGCYTGYKDLGKGSIWLSKRLLINRNKEQQNSKRGSWNQAVGPGRRSLAIMALGNSSENISDLWSRSVGLDPENIRRQVAEPPKCPNMCSGAGQQFRPRQNAGWVGFSF